METFHTKIFEFYSRVPTTSIRLHSPRAIALISERMLRGVGSGLISSCCNFLFEADFITRMLQPEKEMISSFRVTNMLFLLYRAFLPMTAAIRKEIPHCESP